MNILDCMNNPARFDNVPDFPKIRPKMFNFYWFLAVFGKNCPFLAQIWVKIEKMCLMFTTTEIDLEVENTFWKVHLKAEEVYWHVSYVLSICTQQAHVHPMIWANIKNDTIFWWK